MSKIQKIEVELTEEEATRIRALLESGDDDAIAEEMSKIELAATLREAATALREQMMRDVILNAHHWLHRGEPDKALMLLCPMASILEGEMPPAEVIRALTDALNAGNTARAKSDCEGSA